MTERANIKKRATKRDTEALLRGVLRMLFRRVERDSVAVVEMLRSGGFQPHVPLRNRMGDFYTWCDEHGATLLTECWSRMEPPSPDGTQYVLEKHLVVRQGKEIGFIASLMIAPKGADDVRMDHPGFAWGFLHADPRVVRDCRHVLPDLSSAVDEYDCQTTPQD